MKTLALSGHWNALGSPQNFYFWIRVTFGVAYEPDEMLINVEEGYLTRFAFGGEKIVPQLRGWLIDEMTSRNIRHI